jgi:shikimate dehydrogenase
MTETIPTLCGSVAGKPSPLGVKMHDAGYQALGLTFKYVAMGTDDLNTVVEATKRLNFRGFGVSMPFKQEVIKHLDEVTPEVTAIGACNTVVLNDGRLTGYNTDWRGAVAAIKEVTSEHIQSATIIGSGGAAMAIAYGLKDQGLKVYIAARSLVKRTALVQQLHLDGDSSVEDQGQFGSTLIVNATPIAEGSECPLVLAKHPKGRVLLDVVFGKKQTPLGSEASSMGWKVAAGWRMLLHQALAQFELYTGQPAPAEEMGKVLSDALS